MSNCKKCGDSGIVSYDTLYDTMVEHNWYYCDCEKGKNMEIVANARKKK